MISPRFGTRPASVKTSPPSVSTVSSSPSGRRLIPCCSSSASIGMRASAMMLPSGRSIRVGVSGDVVLVLDLADDLLDQILDRHQPVDAAELVDHHRDMRARLAHLHEQVEDRQ